MDADTKSPAARFFIDESFTLVAPDANGKNDAVLWMSFNFLPATLDLAVYDDRTKTYTHKFEGTTAADVIEFIQGIEADFGVSLPADFTELPTTFVALKDQSFSLNLENERKGSICEACGDYNLEYIEAFYFPAINPFFPASIAAHWGYGCFGGESVFGTVEEAEDAIELIDKSLNFVERANELTMATSFITRLKAVTS